MIFNAPELSRDLATQAGISVSNARDHVDIVFAVIERELRNGGEVRMESKTDHD